MKPKLTKWFDGRKFTPSHDGVYEVWFSIKSTYYCLFSNGKWRLASSHIHFANEEKYSMGNQNRKWRGLADKP